MEHVAWEESGLQKYPRIAYQAKPNEVIVFNKPFMVEGEKYNAISQNNDGALLIFDYDAPEKEENEGYSTGNNNIGNNMGSCVMCMFANTNWV